MHKSLLIASFAVLTASVFGMSPDYHGERSNRSGHNQLLRDIKRENPTETNISTESPQENSQSNEINGNNLISSMLKILSENDIFKSEVRDKDAEIQKLTQEKDSKIRELMNQLAIMKRRLIKANNDVFNKFYEKSPRKRSRSVEEEEIQREFEFLHSNKLRNVISQNNEAIAEYKSKQESLKAEIQKLTESNQEKDKTIIDLENDKKDLKQKLDEVNQKLEKQKTKKLKVFEGKNFNAATNFNINLSEYGSFPNLENLEIRASQLSDILRNKPDLSKVTYLDIKPVKSPLDPIELANLLSLTKNVKELDLRSNSLISLPKEIGNLQNLKYLYLPHNNLTELPKEIGNLQNLRYLYVDDNDLARLPAEICALPKLKELDVQNNSLEKLSKEMFVSSNIKINQ